MGKKVNNTYVGNIYESKRHPGVFATVVDEDLDRKTVGIKDNGTGKETSVNLSTLQRWWKKVDNVPAPATPVNDTQNPVVPDPVQDPTPATPDKPAKGKKTPKVKKDPLDNEILKYVIGKAEELGATTFVPAPKEDGGVYKFRIFKYEGKCCAYLNFGAKKCVLKCRGAATQLTPTTTLNHMFNYGFDLFTLDDNTKVLIDTILNDAIKDQKQRNTHKNKKGEN